MNIFEAMHILRNEPGGLTDELSGPTSTRALVFANERGSVTVEYAVLLSLVSLGCVFAIIGLGVPLVRMYQANQAWLMLPIP